MKRSLPLFLSLALALCGAASAAPGVAAKLSHDEIVEVQHKLRAMNFAVTVTGIMDDQTRSAIHKLLVANNDGIGDFLSDEEFAKLKNTDISGFRYAAISASTDGVHVAVWGKKTMDEAEDETSAACRRRSSHKCVTVGWSTGFDGEGWVSAVHCARRTGRFIDDNIQVVGGRTRAGTIEHAFQWAAADGFPRTSCKLIDVVEAGGHHTRK